LLFNFWAVCIFCMLILYPLNSWRRFFYHPVDSLLILANIFCWVEILIWCSLICQFLLLLSG
jgi:hypothetical protein